MWRKTEPSGAGICGKCGCAGAGRIVGEQNFFGGDIFGGVEEHAGHEGNVGLGANVRGPRDGQQAAKHFERVDARFGDDVKFNDLARIVAIGEGAVACGAIVDGDGVRVGVAAG